MDSSSWGTVGSGQDANPNHISTCTFDIMKLHVQSRKITVDIWWMEILLLQRNICLVITGQDHNGTILIYMVFIACIIASRFKAAIDRLYTMHLRIVYFKVHSNGNHNLKHRKFFFLFTRNALKADIFSSFMRRFSLMYRGCYISWYLMTALKERITLC